MNEEQEPRNQEGEPPTHDPKDTETRLEQKADAQMGEANRARTEEKARAARGDGKGRDGDRKGRDGDGERRERGDGKGRAIRFGG